MRKKNEQIITPITSQPSQHQQIIHEPSIRRKSPGWIHESPKQYAQHWQFRYFQLGQYECPK
jgi:hypothetical protein